MDERINSKRLEYFSDAVMAVAITLMVLRIEVPVLIEDETLGDAFLRETLPAIAFYLITFYVIVIFWLHHHDIFLKAPETASSTVLVANMAFLAAICLLPFGLEFFSFAPHAYGTTAVYAGLMAACSLTLSWLQKAALGAWSAATLARAGIFLLAIPLAPLLGGWCVMVWFLHWPLDAWLARRAKAEATA